MEHRRLEELLTVFIQELGSCDPHAAYTVFYTALLCLPPVVRSQEVQDGVQKHTDWRACTVAEGLCSTPLTHVHGNTHHVTVNKYDFTRHRTVRVYKPGQLAEKSAEQLGNHVWLPEDRDGAAFDVLLFLSKVGADDADKLVPVAVEVEFSGELSFHHVCYSCADCALTTAHLATPASREDFISKRSLVMSEVSKLGVDDRVSVEDLVVNVLSWHNPPHYTSAALPDGVLACGRFMLRDALGPALLHLLDAVALSKQ
jgi:hypothetical protein